MTTLKRIEQNGPHLLNRSLQPMSVECLIYSREYVPPRGQAQQTPEIHDNGSLHLPQRTAKRTNQLSNDDFEDPVEGLEMSDNLGGSKRPRLWPLMTQVSEETHMKLEITRLQPEVGRMRDHRRSQSGSGKLPSFKVKDACDSKDP
ncbi:hypothetical protein PABG_11145 [Paracoccidioides brasiliensis Pb03]|uniref:Uncharacterized protein n=1 Tax=Paracoccidioides brasiliensis TaxID=121759 RepID=A0A1D2JIG7_PARBR|nr:hypothetical protein PABG_11145 [Paracoccidioides brasiliensis Pb03]ODH38179.1 hypothetical protein ACO22_02510 [Paracoccidioides brasiliensis]